MSIHKDKKRNTWYVKYSNKTKRGFQTKAEAKVYEMRMKSGINTISKENTNVVFSFVANDYVESKKNEVSFSSYIVCRDKVKIYIIPNIEDKEINLINELDCKRFKDYLYKLSICSRSKNTILNHFKAIFFHAEKYYGLKHNPTRFIKPFKATFDEKMKRKEKEVSIWTTEEFEKFIVFVEKEKYKTLFIILYFTGTRLGEALALTWIDLKDHKISINKSLTKVSENGACELKDTKTVSSIRDISLNDSLYLYLLNVKKEEMKNPDFLSSWYICGGRKPLSRTRVTKAKDDAIKLSGVKRIKLHDFRHSHASNLINEGINIVAVSRRLGHSDVSMTLKVYTHLINKNDDYLVDYLEKSSHNLLTAQKVDKS